MMGRSALVNLPMLGAVPRIRYAIPARELVEARFGALADWPERAYEMSTPAPKIERSRSLASVHGVEYWLRFPRSEEHTSELQSLMRISYAVFCLKKKTN